jgi:Synaptobrevin
MAAEQRSVAAKILWSCVARNDVILAEAAAAQSNDSEAVAQTARELLARPATPGFEFHTTRFWFTSRKQQQQRRSTGSEHEPSPAQQQQQQPSQTPTKTLKGIKFHLYEHVNPLDDYDATLDGISATTTMTTDVVSPTVVKETPQLCLWVFAAVYDPTTIHDRAPVQAFLEKIVLLSENFRLYDPSWHTVGTLGLQDTFAPILQQQMSNAREIATFSKLQGQIQACQEQMERNIALLLERGEKIDDLHANATRLQEMALVFQKRARDVKRYQMRNHARHGLLLGTAVTAVVAVVVVPPLVAIL